MSDVLIGVIGLAVLIILVLLRMPIGLAMALIGFVGIIYLNNFNVAFDVLGMSAWGSSINYTLCVLPLFLLMGQIAIIANLDRDLYDACYKWLGHMRGGLAIATTAACAGFAAICGDALTGTATLASVSFPQMRRHNYSISLASGCIAAGGTLGILIPPSIILILYGVITEQSIGDLFIAGFLPGLLLALLYGLVIYIICTIRPDQGPRGPKVPFKEQLGAFKEVWYVILLFIAIIGGIYIGVFTPTEAGAVGAFGAFIILFIKRRANFKSIGRAIMETMRLLGLIYIIVIGATIFSVFLSLSTIPMELSDGLVALGYPPIVNILFIIFVFIIFGCFIDSLALVLLFTPIFFPVVVAMGFDPIWFGVIIVIVMQQAMMTPPIGMSCFIMSAVAKDVPMSTIFRGVMPFWFATIVCIIILLAFPQIALVLVNLMHW